MKQAVNVGPVINGPYEGRTFQGRGAWYETGGIGLRLASGAALEPLGVLVFIRERGGFWQWRPREPYAIEAEKNPPHLARSFMGIRVVVSDDVPADEILITNGTDSATVKLCGSDKP